MNVVWTLLDTMVWFGREGGSDTIAEATHVLSKSVIRNYLCAEGKKYLDSSSEECNIICYCCRDRGHRAVNCPKQTKQQDTTKLDRKQTVTCFSCGM